ncbi:MAG: alpha/beta hydrolase [Paludibacteraceae bacterium]|nr:alpha/beta hydrolase [Paludibacteraceae bacterium]
MKRLLFILLPFLGLNSFAQYGGFGGFGGGENLSSYTSKKDINYVGDGKTYHAMDVYYPKESKDSYPVIIHVYGSAWSSNNGKGNADLGTVGKAAVDAGYIFVTPNHRSNSDAQWPGQINDIKAVVRYLRGNAQELKVDTSFIAISGFSSGGHLATMMGTSRNVKEYTVGSTTMDIEGNLGRFTDFSSSVDAVCDWSGPVILDKVNCGNAMDLNSFITPLFGNCSASQCPDKYALATAVTFIDPSDPPYIIVHGSADQIVAQCQSEMLYKELQKGGIECEYIPTGSEHGVNGDKCPDMISFFNKAREKKAAAATSNDEVKALGIGVYKTESKIILTENERTSYVLLDITGKIVGQGVVDDEGINIEYLPYGVYILRLGNGLIYKFFK